MAANTDPPAAPYPSLNQDGNRQPPSEEPLPSPGDSAAQVKLAATISRLRDEASQHAASASSARESDERLRLAIAASGMGIWDLDPISRELSWSDHCYELFGLTVGTQVTYDTFLAGIHPEDRAVADADVQQALDPMGDGRYARTFRVVGIETGIERWLASTGQAFFDPTGQAVRFIGTIQDVSRSMKAEAALRASEERFHSAFADAAVGMAVVNPAGMLTQVNHAFRAVTGFTTEELIGRDINLLVHPDHRAEHARQVRRLMEGELSTVVLRERYQRKDGANAWVQESVTLLRDAASHPVGRITLLEDITARRQAEGALEAGRNRVQQILEVLPVGVIVANANGEFTMSNALARAAFGLNLEGRAMPRDPDTAYDAYGIRHLDGSPFPSEELPLQRSLLRGEQVRGEQLLIRHAETGADVPLMVNSTPLRGPGGSIIGAITVWQDISEWRALERAREEFLSSAAHDLKTPLTSIRGQAQLARRRLERLALPETEAISAQMQVIDSSTTHMVDLINDLVDVTRSQLEHGEHLHRIRVDLVSLAQEVVAQQQISAVHRIELRTSLTSLKARVDGPRVHRLLNNLLSNAVKYSPNGGVIQVRLSRDTGPEGPEAVIAVRDQGIGIPVSDLPRIFERFQRASNVLAHIQGTGIGLASVQRIVALHGGTVTAANNAEGGATFTVRLPLGPIDNDA